MKKPWRSLRGIHQAPGRKTIHFRKGLALKALGENQEALDAFTLVLELKPDCIYALDQRGYTLSNLKSMKKQREPLKRRWNIARKRHICNT